MFTGLIEEVAIVTALTPLDAGLRIGIQCSARFKDISLGESIAIDGACMTVVSFELDSTASREALEPEGRQQTERSLTEPVLFEVEVSSESLRLTTLGQYGVGSRVNLERALLPTQRLGGHFVTGHIDGLVELASVEPGGIGHILTFRFTESSQAHRPSVIPKGSVALNGISLTVNHVTESGFDVMIIPHTWAMTNLSTLQVGDKLNFEADMLVKAVQAQLEAIGSLQAH